MMPFYGMNPTMPHDQLSPNSNEESQPQQQPPVASGADAAAFNEQQKLAQATYMHFFQAEQNLTYQAMAAHWNAMSAQTSPCFPPGAPIGVPPPALSEQLAAFSQMQAHAQQMAAAMSPNFGVPMVPHYGMGGMSAMYPMAAMNQNVPDQPKKRTRYTDFQKGTMEKRFQENPNIDKYHREKLAAQIGLSDLQVKVWFQNRRHKARSEERAGLAKPEVAEANQPESVLAKMLADNENARVRDASVMSEDMLGNGMKWSELSKIMANNEMAREGDENIAADDTADSGSFFGL